MTTQISGFKILDGNGQERQILKMEMVGEVFLLMVNDANFWSFQIIPIGISKRPNNPYVPTVKLDQKFVSES